jgi:cytochrome c5
MQKKKFLMSATIGIFTLSLFFTVPATAQMMGGSMMGGRRMCDTTKRMPKTGVKPEDLPAPGSMQAKTYAKFCSQCHLLPDPKGNSAKGWEKLVERMDKKMRMMSHMRDGIMGVMNRIMGREMMEVMNAAEKSIIIEYLGENGLKTLDRTKFDSIDTPEYKTYEQACSTCHDLPDPSVHTESEWPKIVQKMKEKMGEMGVDLPSSEEERLLLKFLTENTRT